VNGDADVASAAALIGEPARAGLLLALMEAEPLPARELAIRAGIAPSTASGHLAKLVAGGLLVAESSGRHRFFRLADRAVAQALEALAAIAPEKPVQSLREATAGEAIRVARTCYDHLAGRLGVELTSALEREGTLLRQDGTYELGPSAEQRLSSLGIELAGLAKRRRALARLCLDWTERRPHVAGAVGAALAERLFELGWVEPRAANRSVEITPRGRAQLEAEFGIRL
jgi:DNA-binding transcriptional ArsR family regulator